MPSDHPDRRQLWWAVWKTLCTAVSLAALLFVATLWLFDFPAVHRDGLVSAGTLVDLARTILLTVAGVGGVVGLVVAYRRQQNGEAENRRAEVKLFFERFAKSSELLGHDRAAVRLAAVHSLAGLADDWPDGRQTCVDVLCAYLRMPFTAAGEYALKQTPESRGAQQELQVRQTVIRIIGRRLAPGSPRRWDGIGFDFTGAVFDGGDLRNARFAPGTVLSFRTCRFRTGTLDFAEACFAGGVVDLDDTVFDGGVVDLSKATTPDGQPPATLHLPAAPPAGLRLPVRWTPVL